MGREGGWPLEPPPPSRRGPRPRCVEPRWVQVLSLTTLANIESTVAAAEQPVPPPPHPFTSRPCAAAVCLWGSTVNLNGWPGTLDAGASVPHTLSPCGRWQRRREHTPPATTKRQS